MNPTFATPASVLTKPLVRTAFAAVGVALAVTVVAAGAGSPLAGRHDAAPSKSNPQATITVEQGKTASAYTRLYP